MLNKKRRILWADDRPESTHSPNRKLPCFTHKTPHKNKNDHTQTLSRGPASCTSQTTYLHIPNFLTGALRERDKDPKPRFLDLRREHLVQKNTETRNGTRHSNSAAKTTPKQLETEFYHAILTTILYTLGADDRTPNICCTTTDQNNANHLWFIAHPTAPYYGHAFVGPAVRVRICT